jgi:hypothetical protein
MLTLYIQQLQHYTVYFIWKHVLGGTIIHNQEHKQLHLQHLGICHTVTATCRHSGRQQ